MSIWQSLSLSLSAPLYEKYNCLEMNVHNRLVERQMDPYIRQRRIDNPKKGLEQEPAPKDFAFSNVLVFFLTIYLVNIHAGTATILPSCRISYVKKIVHHIL